MYQIFVADDDAPAFVGDALEHLPNTQGRTIDALLAILSKVFVQVDKDGDSLMVDSQAEDFDDEDDFGADFSEDEPFDIDGNAKSYQPSASAQGGSVKSVTSARFRDRVRMDLNVAKAAGFKVGAFGGLLQGDSCYVTLSCRVSKLGISDEAMEAWQLTGKEYLILLIHFPNGYKTADDVEGYDPHTARLNMEFRVGCSNHYKPTVQETIMAFAQVSQTKQKEESDSQSWVDPDAKGFKETFISKPLNQLFNERLPTILRYRLTGMSWMGAEQFFNDHQGKNIGVDGDFLDVAYMKEEAINNTLPSIVTLDHLVDAPQPYSLPLLAIQFLLRHFVRCTEFCLVCHCKLDLELEAIKPYVCDKPLCLYQYMSLGFGPSIEHEITSQPFVVDLLLSFCYAQIAANKLREFPTGLSLSVPDVPIAHVNDIVGAPGVLKARYDPSTNEMMFEKGASCPFNTGDWLVLQLVGDKNAKIFHCRVKEQTYFPTVRLSAPVFPPEVDQTQKPVPYGRPAAPLAGMKADSKSTQSPPARLEVAPGFHEVLFFVYSHNFDTLNSTEQCQVMLRLLELIPPVKVLREHLLKHPDTTLAKWHDRISPASLGILRWVIASNRACIMQPSSSDKMCDYRVHGMKDWMQFRFAMGAPDKERRFINSMNETKERKKLSYPTIYAWHGSPLFNWHSIIREGLHFKNTDHGRAFGHGVYHSLDFNTSSGYSGYYNYYNSSGIQTQYPQGWPGSELKISTAMALNEVVNAPDEFVSRTPHLVVAQLEWIQTRFLFVRINSETKPFGLEENSSIEFHAQDPSFTPKGENGPIKIPLHATRLRPRAVSVSRPDIRPSNKRSAARSFFGAKKGPANDLLTLDDINDSDTTDDDDRKILLDEDAQISASQHSGFEKETASKVGGFKSMFSTKNNKPSKPLTDFVPGELDHSTLPRLQEPQFATLGATRRLQKDFQSLVRLQQLAVAENTMHELGWWVDPEKFDNVYQWIVELHSFDQSLPLAKQMKQKDLKSIVMEMRFGPDYPMSPPFIRIIRPRFMSFLAGGGGHVTAGGSLCMEVRTARLDFQGRTYLLTCNSNSFSQTPAGLPSRPLNRSCCKSEWLSVPRTLAQLSSKMEACETMASRKPSRHTFVLAKSMAGAYRTTFDRWHGKLRPLAIKGKLYPHVRQNLQHSAWWRAHDEWAR